MKIKMNRQKSISPSKVGTVVNTEKSRGGRFLLETRHTKTTEWRNKVRRKTRHLTIEHEHEISECVETKPKKVSKYVKRKSKSKEAIPALKRTDWIIATKGNDKVETLDNFSRILL